MPKSLILRRTSAAALLALCTCAASAQRYFYFGGGCTSLDGGVSLDFGFADCWSDAAGGSGGWSIPGGDDDAYVLSFAPVALTSRFSIPRQSPLAMRLGSLAVLGRGGAAAELDIARGYLYSLGGIGVGSTLDAKVQTGFGRVFQDGADTRVDFNQTLAIGQQAGSFGDYFLRGGTLTGTNGFSVIQIGNSGSGLLDQSGGSLEAWGMLIGGDVGSRGSFFQSAGTATFEDGIVIVGRSGATPSRAQLALSGGTLTAGGGGITQSGSRHTGSAIINIDGGTLQADWLDVAAVNVGSIYGRSGSFEHNQSFRIDQLTVGREGTGTLVLRPVQALSSNLWESGDVAIGALGTGIATVSGEGTTGFPQSDVSQYSHRWQISGTLGVGLLGTGTLVVSNAAGVSSAHGLIGGSSDTVCSGMSFVGAIGGCRLAPPGQGSVTVTGLQSLWQTGTLTVGAPNGGRGELLVLDNARVAVSGHTAIGALGKITSSGGGRFETGTLAAESGGLITLRGGTLAATFGAQMQGTLRVLSGGVSSFEGALALGPTGRLELDAGTLRLNRALTTTSGSVVELRGGTLATSSATEMQGKLRVLSGGASSFEGALSLGETGRLELDAGTLRLNGALATSSGGVVELRDGALAVSGGSQVQGTLRVLSGSSSVVDGAVVLGETGRLEVGTSQVSFRGALTAETGAHIHNDGEMLIENRALLQVGVGLSGSGAKYVFGSLALADDSAQFTDTNALALMPGSVLEVDLSGADHHDRYTTQAWMLLGGTLKLSSGHGYQGLPGDRFTILGGRLEGAFDGVDTSGFALAPGLSWDFSQLNSAGIVGIQGALAPSPVPEPGAWALMLAGLAAVGRVASRRSLRP